MHIVSASAILALLLTAAPTAAGFDAAGIDLWPRGDPLWLPAGARDLAAPLAPDPEADADGFRPLDWLPLALLLAANGVAQFAVDPPEDSRWTSRNSFDDGIRSALVKTSRGGRDAASIASDALFGGLAGLLAVDWWWLRAELPILDSARTDASWLLGNNLATRVAKLSAARERPYGRPCDGDRDYVSGCHGDDRNASFFSGHASNSAALAGLLCARRLHRPERRWPDVLLCGGAAAAAATTGVLRIVSDDHFATDVIAGWASGALLGYALPSRFHYAATRVTPVVGRRSVGLRFAVEF